MKETKQENKKNQFRSRKFQILAYPESSPNLIDILKNLGWDFIGILHDKDKNKDGSIKKPHWHIYLSFVNACFNSSIVRQLGLSDNFVRKMEKTNEVKFLAYLTHFQSKDKHKYDDSELIYSSDAMLELVMNARNQLETAVFTESQKVTCLLKLIDELGITTMKKLVEVACYNELYDVLRRSGGIFSAILKEKLAKNKTKCC